MVKIEFVKPSKVIVNKRLSEDETGHGLIILEVVLGKTNGYLTLTMGLQGFEEKDQIWLSEVVSKNIEKAYIHGYNEGRDEVRKMMKMSLGLN